MKDYFAVLHFQYPDKKSITEGETKWEEVMWDLRPNKAKRRGIFIEPLKSVNNFTSRNISGYWFFH